MPHVAASKIADQLASLVFMEIVMEIEGPYQDYVIPSDDRIRLVQIARRTIRNELVENPEIRRWLKELTED